VFWWWCCDLKWSRTLYGVLGSMSEILNMVKENVARIGGRFLLGKLSRVLRQVLQAKSLGE
jgi:hypothetical protein